MRQNDLPFFTVCIPVYNAEAYLEECVRSVLRQTEQDFEIILVDDGSADRSGQLCDEFAARYSSIRALHKKNAGPLMARHDAVGMSRGQYLMFLDSDDFYEPTLLAGVRRVISDTLADMVVFDFREVHTDGRTVVKTEPYADGTVFEGEGKKAFYMDLIAGHSLNSMWRKCIRRDVYDREADYTPYRGMIQGEDKLVSLHCVDRAEKIVYLKAPMYSYRANPGSTSHNIALKNYCDIQILHTETMRYIAHWELPDSARDRQLLSRLGFACNCVISVACRIQSGKATEQELREAVAYISGDEQFTAAYRLCGNRLRRYRRIVCSCIVKQRIWLLKLVAAAVQLRAKR